MDIYQILDLPDLSDLSAKQQREILTERYIQVMARTQDATHRAHISEVWQNAMDQTEKNKVEGDLKEWVKQGEQMVQSSEESSLAEFAKRKEKEQALQIFENNHKQIEEEIASMPLEIINPPKTLANKKESIEQKDSDTEKSRQKHEEETQSNSGDKQLVLASSVYSLKKAEVFSSSFFIPEKIDNNLLSKENFVKSLDIEEDRDLLLLPCPFGHQHLYEKDTWKTLLLLRCPSCKAMFSVLAFAKCVYAQTNQALSFREKEWAVDYGQKERVFFRGSNEIALENGEYFSLISFGGNKEDIPLWLVNHSQNHSTWALSGKGTVAFSESSPAPPTTQLQLVLWGYLVPFVFFFLLSLAFFTPIWGVIMALLFVLFAWRPFVVPVLFPSLGEFSLVGRIKVFWKRKKGEF